MNKREKQSYLTVCKRFSDKMKDLGSILETYLANHKEVRNRFEEIFMREHEADNKYPQHWWERQAEAYLHASAFSNRRTLSTMLTSKTYEIDTSVREVIETWYEDPIRWNLFEIEKVLGDGFFSIFELESEEERIIYSPGIEQMQKRSESRDGAYITLLFYNGKCWQTQGPIHSYRSLHIFEIEEFCRIIDRPLLEKEHFHGFVQEHFLRFFMLDEISVTPSMSHRGETLRQHWQEMHLEGFDPSRLVGKWETELLGSRYEKLTFDGITDEEIERLELDERYYSFFHKDRESFWEAPTMRYPTLYHDKEEQKLYLSAMTFSGYELLCHVLSATYPEFMDEEWEPAWDMNMTLVSLIKNTEGLTLPWSAITDLFDTPHSHPEHEQSDDGIDMEKMNKLLGDIMEAHNTGKTFNKKQASTKYGISEEEISDIEKQIGQMFARQIKEIAVPEADKRYAISYRVPSPKERRKFQDALGSPGGPFTVFEEGETTHSFHILTGNSFAREVDGNGIADHLSTVFEEAFGWNSGMTIMNTFFYILQFTRETPTPVRSFAWEILKLFGHVLLPDLHLTEEEFIARFSRFVLKKMCPNAICEVSGRPDNEDLKRGTYPIKSTVFFEDFLELNQ